MMGLPMSSPIDWNDVARAILGSGAGNDPQVLELGSRLRQQHDVPGVSVEFRDGSVYICHAHPPAGIEEGFERLIA